MCSGVYSTGELPPGTVLGLTVDDPRLTLPSKKVKALTCVKQAQGKIWPTRPHGAWMFRHSDELLTKPSTGADDLGISVFFHKLWLILLRLLLWVRVWFCALGGLCLAMQMFQVRILAGPCTPNTSSVTDISRLWRRSRNFGILFQVGVKFSSYLICTLYTISVK